MSNYTSIFNLSDITADYIQTSNAYIDYLYSNNNTFITLQNNVIPSGTIDLGSSTYPFDDVYSNTNTINNTLTLNGSVYLNSSSNTSLMYSYYAGSNGSSSEGGIAIGFAHGNFQYYNGSTSTYWQFFDSNGNSCLEVYNNGAGGAIAINDGSINVPVGIVNPSLTGNTLLYNNSNKRILSATVTDSNNNLAFSSGTLSFVSSPTFSNLTINSTSVVPLLINSTSSACQIEFENNSTPIFTLNGLLKYAIEHH